MLSFVQNFMAPKANPIGVDFGSDSLRMAQVRFENGQLQLVAAAAPGHLHLRHPQAVAAEVHPDRVGARR